MATGTVVYGTPVNMTTSAVSLGVSAYCKTIAVENSVSALDYLVGGLLQVAAATSLDGSIEIYAYGLVATSTYTAGLTSAGTSITWGTVGSTGVDGYLDLPFLGRSMVDATDASDYKYFGPYSVAQAFGGILPRKWGLVIRNNQTTPLHATGTNNQIVMTPIKFDFA